MVEMEKINNALNAPVREIAAQVVFYKVDEETKEKILFSKYSSTDKLKEITIERIGDNSKFFGFGICQKANIKIIDKDRRITNLSAGDIAVVGFKVENMLGYDTLPEFTITEIHRDELTNELSITAYDRLYFLAEHTIEEISYRYNFNYYELTRDISTILGYYEDIETGDIYIDYEPIFSNIALDEYKTPIGNSANIEGTETMREILNAIAEATQSVYYLTGSNLCFTRLDIDGAPVYTIDKNNYFSLQSGDNRRLTKIMHATELGDNISAELPMSGSTQYVRNNPFWDNNEDIINIVNNALANVAELTINQFECNWRGSYLLELCDKIAIVGKDDSLITTYLLNDTIKYNGGLTEHTSWRYEESEAEAADNPTSIGEVVKYTYAKVDKINREIEIVASETEQGAKELAQIKLDTQNIKTKVENTEKEINTITKSVEMAVTADELSIAVQKELENGVDKVTTATGFTFDADGLKVTKSGSEISTQITEDGMSVSNGSNEVLSANNQGVTAIDLHATTFLIIGENSRLENYEGRTGCFWIGGE